MAELFFKRYYVIWILEAKITQEAVLNVLESLTMSM